jgi:hypothetical protein
MIQVSSFLFNFVIELFQEEGRAAFKAKASGNHRE